MRWKPTLVLLLLTVGLGAYVSMRELKQPTQEERQNLDKRVVNLHDDRVTAIDVAWPSTKAQLAKTDTGWRLTQPIAARADEGFIQRLLNQLAPLQAERVLTPTANKPLPLAEFGLEPPKGTLKVSEGTTATTTLLFGETTPVGGNRYAKRPDSPNVFIVNAGIFDQLSQPIEAYRSYDVWPFESWKVRRIAVTADKGAFTLEKQGDRWRLISPIDDLADAAMASTVLSKLRGLRVERIISDQPKPEELKTWGLEPPSTKIALTLADRKEPLELSIGATTTDIATQRYAKRADEPTVVAIAKDHLDNVLQDPASLRSMGLIEFFANQVNKAQWTWQGASWTLQKQDGQWKLAERPTVIDGSKVDEWLWKLHDLRAVRVIQERATTLAQDGLEPPDGVIRVWSQGSEKPQELRIGHAIGQGQTRFGFVDGRSVEVELPQTIVELLTTTPESLQPTAQPSPSSPPTPSSAPKQ